MPYEVITHRSGGVGLRPYRDEPFQFGEVIPDNAFNVLPKGERTRRVLLNTGWIKPTEEPGVVKIDEDDEGDTWPRWAGGPWFLTPDGQKHRGKKKALAHMGNT